MSEILTRNELVHAIKVYIPNEPIQFTKNKQTNTIEIHFKKRTCFLQNLEECTWNEIKQYIDAAIQKKEKNNECSICYSSIEKKMVSCKKCIHVHCINCFVKNLKVNKGIMKCPTCRHTVSNCRIPDDVIDICIQDLILNFSNIGHFE